MVLAPYSDSALAALQATCTLLAHYLRDSLVECKHGLTLAGTLNNTCRHVRLQAKVGVHATRSFLSTRARASGREVDVPCCYGLYETKSSLFLVMDYVGEAVPGLELNEIKYTDK